LASVIFKVKLALLALAVLFLAYVALTVIFWGIMAWLLAALYVLATTLAVILGVGFGIYIFVRRDSL
jgi:hypothetical protein